LVSIVIEFLLLTFFGDQKNDERNQKSNLPTTQRKGTVKDFGNFSQKHLALQVVRAFA
jgi:hypothetical protein